nr:hypothetical protein [Desulfotruncus alcoholivorax]
MDYITAIEAAEKWGISQRRVQLLCEQGRVAEAVRLGWTWAIPALCQNLLRVEKTPEEENAICRTGSKT